MAWSVSCVRVLRVNKWEAFEFFLVQVGYKLLIWGGQLWGVAREKAIKVLRITPTLPWRGEERERWREDGVSLMMRWCGEKKDNKRQREKREIQLKHGINQSNRSQPKLWISIGPYVSQWHFSFIIGDYTHKSQLICICQSSEQWQAMVGFGGDEWSNRSYNLPSKFD